MKSKVLMLTTAGPRNAFPENFSCWCAGALEAKGCGTTLEVINLRKIITGSSNEPLEIEEEKLTVLQNNLSLTDKIVLVLPEYNNMLPVGLDNFITLVSESKHKLCKFISIVMDLPANHDNDRQGCSLFRYPICKLDMFLGTTFSASRTQIKNSPTGNMCPLFAESYGALCELIQQILS
ncbi:NADPH-dependent FMN reductase [Cardinium endosymbiont cBtQ1 of Bemisia tabaci]|nr:NADPH-dependent FMN reductase [Cardinium endosymbiont cBtQ1 of Bemisia tabaci]